MTEISPLIIHCLSTHYLIEVTDLTLLPLGADMNASVYKAQARDGKTYFIKLKRGYAQDTSAAILELLQTEGIQQIIPLIKTRQGNSVQQVGDCTLTVYPFIQGQDGFRRSLTDLQWVAFGQTLRRIHAIDVPSAMQQRLRREDFSSQWRDAVRSLYRCPAPKGDELALQLCHFLQERQETILHLVDCSEQLSLKISDQRLSFVLCHGDIHGGNVLLDNAGAFYIVDWEAPLLAPKERDLLFIGGGVGNVWNQAREEELFYQGYGQIEVNRALLAYYRSERILEDLALYAQELLGESTSGKDRREMLPQFLGMFAPQGVIEIAFNTEKTLKIDQ